MKQFYRLQNFNSPLVFITLIIFSLTGIKTTNTSAQVAITESFTMTQFPPNGWLQYSIYGSNAFNFFVRATSSTFPASIPASGHTAPAFLKYNSRTAFPAGSCLVSKRFDMSGRPSCNAAGTVSFWLYRDNYLPGSHDTVRVFMDTANTFIPATNPNFINTHVLLSGPSPSPLTRPYLDAPAATVNTWVQYTYNIPAGRCTDHEYVHIVTGSAGGGNTYIDDIVVTTWPSTQVFNTTNMYYQDVTPVTKGATNKVIIGVNVNMDKAGNPGLVMDSISLNTNGTTNITDIQNAKLWYTGGSSIFYATQQFGATIANLSTTPVFPGNLTFNRFSSVASGSLVIGQTYIVAGAAGSSINHNAIVYNTGTSFTAVNTSFAIVTNPSGNCAVLPYIPLAVGNNYFWLTYDVLAGATSGNCVDAEYSGCYIEGSNVLNVANVNTMAGCREISTDYCNGVTPVMIWGTQEQSDFVRHVALYGEASVNPTLPFINNALNDHGPPTSPYFGGPAPFSAHPPDYELFDPVPGRTCVLKQGAFYAAPTVDYMGPGLTIQADADVGFDPNYVNVWIDFNHDGDFMDPGEQLLPNVAAPTPGGNYLYGLTTTNRAVTVPAAGGVASPGVAGAAGSIVGPTRMRVRASESVPAMDPCTGGAVEGETEDYIVTIMPNCIAGVKTWLGYTDDWNTPANWCGGVPTINDIALVQFSASGTPAAGYHRPVIHNGVTATAQTIRLASGDTLYADAESGASLTIRDSLSINYSAAGNGHVKVNSAYSSTAKISNGTLGFNITPFMASRKNCRMQLVFTAADFANQGIVAGNVIDELWFEIIARATNPYGASPNFQGIYYGFTVSYAYCTAGWDKWPAPPVTSLASTGAFTTLYSGNLDMNGPVPSGGLGAPGATGTLKIPVSSFVYTGGDMVLNFCYNNSAIGTASTFTNDLLQQTFTTNAYRTMWIHNSNSPAGCVINWIAGVLAAGNSAAIAYYRPNITFKYHRVFSKFPINIGTSAATVNGVTVLGASTGHFNNNSNGAALTDGFEAGKSVVTFGSNLAIQTITGLKSTLFNDLTVSKTVGAVSQIRAVVVDSFLTLTNGAFLLNLKTLTANYGASTAVTRTNGYLVSEDPTGLAKLSWNIGANSLGVNHEFPFGVQGGNYLPVKLTPAADMGVVSMSTYHTIWNNTPYPTPATHVNNTSGAPNNGAETVDRFWVLDKTGPSANSATLNFSYDNAEAAAPNSITPASSLLAQRWVGSGWAAGLGSSTAGGSVSSQNVPAVTTNFNGPWALSNFSNPLPIELVEFDAVTVQDKVKIWWKTASELDNDYFTVERTVDMKHYDFISRVSTKGNGPVEHNYETYDLQPLSGLQYYRLKTTSINNDESLSKNVPVNFNSKLVFNITAIAGLYEAGLLGVDFICDNSQPCDLVIYDITGQPVYSQNTIPTVKGSNHIDVNIHLSHAVYFVSLRNAMNTINRKLVY